MSAHPDGDGPPADAPRPDTGAGADGRELVALSGPLRALAAGHLAHAAGAAVMGAARAAHARTCELPVCTVLELVGAGAARDAAGSPGLGDSAFGCAFAVDPDHALAALAALADVSVPVP